MDKRNKVRPLITKGVAKVPVVMQMEALECGAACVDMILAYFGKWVALEEVRKQCGVSRDGSNAKNMVLAAKSYGLKAQAYKTEPDVLKEGGAFPCIIHWNFNHFVVLNGFKGKNAVINDPARGTVKISMEEFDKSFTGICIIFEPDEGFVPDGSPKSIRNFVKRRLKDTKSALVFTILITLVVSLIGVIQPGFTRVFTDRLLTGSNPEWLYPFIGGLSVLVFVQIIIGFIQAIYNLKISGKLAVTANAQYMWHIFRLPMGFFSQRLAGDITSRKSSNESIASVMINTFAPLVFEFLMMIFYLGVMIRYSALLTAIGVLSIIVNIITAQILSNQRINVMRTQMIDAAKLASCTVSGIEIIETIKASGAENGYFDRWADYQAAVNSSKVKFAKKDLYIGLIPTLISSLTNLAILTIGVWMIMNGHFTIGMLTAFQSFISAFSSPAKTLISASQTIQEMRTSMERIDDIMEYPEQTYNDTVPKDEEIQKLSGNIEFKNITFGYAPLGKPVLKNISFSVKSGGTIALVGASGCGKSTIAKLIAGLYTPWEGEILFDGKKMDEINRNIFTSSVAVVDQEIVLFEDTVADNIKMWDNSISDIDMIMAAFDAQIHKEISKRELDYDYKIIEGGRNFSGGEKQRIEIARALAQNPTIIVMDEATSALDAKTEYEVVKSIKERNITCIIVAHRLSTIRDCDEIVVIDNGEIVERGTHDELIKQDGHYKSLITNE